MDIAKQYEFLKKFCANRLYDRYHDRHLEDCVQFVAMRVFEESDDFEKRGFRGRWDWYFGEYCRKNGLNSNGESKQSSRTIELSTLVGEDTWMLESEPESEKEMGFTEKVDEFLSFLNLSKETYQWAMKQTQKRLS